MTKQRDTRPGTSACGMSHPWHRREPRAPELVLLTLAILGLSLTDAFLTTALLGKGATEANPLLASIVTDRPAMFLGVKMLLTSGGAIILVAMAEQRLFGLITARSLFRLLVLAYFGLVAYETVLLANTA